MKRLLISLSLFIAAVAVNAEDVAASLVTPGKWVHTYEVEDIDNATGKIVKVTRSDWFQFEPQAAGGKYTHSSKRVGDRYRKEKSGVWTLTGDTLELWEINDAVGHPNRGKKPRKPAVWKVKPVSEGVVEIGLEVEVAEGIDSMTGIEKTKPEVKEWKTFKLEQK